MARTLETVTTSAGTRYSKKVSSDGRQYHVKHGSGQVKQQSYAAAKSNTTAVQVLERGNLGGVEALDDVTDLGEEYAAQLTRDVRQYERGSPERKEAADVNRWLGFRYSQDTPDDPIEAAEQYQEMKNRLKEATSERQERDIKRDYNIGGS